MTWLLHMCNPSINSEQKLVCDFSRGPPTSNKLILAFKQCPAYNNREDVYVWAWIKGKGTDAVGIKWEEHSYPSVIYLESTNIKSVGMLWILSVNSAQLRIIERICLDMNSGDRGEISNFVQLTSRDIFSGAEIVIRQLDMQTMLAEWADITRTVLIHTWFYLECASLFIPLPF